MQLTNSDNGLSKKLNDIANQADAAKGGATPNVSLTLEDIYKKMADDARRPAEDLFKKKPPQN